VGSGSSTLPYGAGVAACIGAANVFRCVFQEHLGQPKLDQDLALNVVNFSTTASAAPVPASIGEIDLGETFLVGLGAIGHAAVWALERQPGLRGVLQLIDDEDYDATNPQRYVGTTHAEAGQKVAALRDRLAAAHRGLDATGHPVTWDEFLHRRNDWRLERVAVAVDSADDRRLIQSSLPRLVLNAWTQRDNVGVSRHEFLNSACLCCLYIPDTQVPDQDDLVAAQLKFGTDEDTVKVVREWIDTGRPMTSDLVAQIETQVSVPSATFAGYVGQPLMSLYQREACGGGILNAGGHLGDGGAAVEVPLAFQSALAGIMLAAEIVCSAAPLRPASLPTRTEINLLAPIKGTLNSPEAKHGSGRCLCQDPDFVAAYRAKYGPVT
jgi:molybdopterin/thiamine biosynthesis adenylyltransferase